MAESGCRSSKGTRGSSALSRAVRIAEEPLSLDPRVYLERYVSQPRHIEVQIFCDGQGHAYALGERECSVQRRHQKIVEESPSPAAFFAGEAGEVRRRELYAAALRVVTKVGYLGAGTCEFIADAEGSTLLLGGERAASGRARRDRDGHRTGPRGASTPRRSGRGASRSFAGREAGPRPRSARLRRGSGEGVHSQAGTHRRSQVGRWCRRSSVTHVAGRIGGEGGEQSHPVLRPHDRQARRLG